MSDRKFIIPEYGPFAGMRVITSGSLIAMPFAATMLADFGAEVIHIERPGVGDTLRMLAPFAEVNGKKVGTAWAQDARNKLSLTLELNLKHPEVKELFYGLIKEADIFMENMVWLDKLGIYDEELLKVNPKLVIVHISGLGNAKFGGIPSVCNRASYDMIGQAFSGWLYLQGFKDRDPVVAKPYMNDFVSAFAALFGTLAAYTAAQKTGKGQVVDVAQFEAMAQYMCGTYTTYTMAGQVTERSGNASPAFQPYDLFESKDGALVALGAFGPGVYKRCIQALGFDLEYFNYKDCSSGVEAVASPKGRDLHGLLIVEPGGLYVVGIQQDEGEGIVQSADVALRYYSCFDLSHFRILLLLIARWAGCTWCGCSRSCSPRNRSPQAARTRRRRGSARF